MSSIQMALSGIIPRTTHSASRSCKRKCPGGYQCGCDASIGHTFHICRNEGCWCHSQDRYNDLPYNPSRA